MGIVKIPMDTITKSRTMNTFIRARDSLVNRLAGVTAGQVLNSKKINPPDFSGWDVAATIKMAMDQFKLAAFNNDGSLIDYAELRQSQAYDEFQNYCLPRLRELNPSDFKTQSEKLAFWINLYNALVVDGIINFQVQSSIIETRLGLLSFFRKAAYNIGGQRLSLDDIEHGILRANRGLPYLPGPHFASDDQRLECSIHKFDHRIHFALNCASRLCPPIRAYRPDHINQQLEIASRSFVDSSTRIKPDKAAIFISAIFNW